MNGKPSRAAQARGSCVDGRRPQPAMARTPLRATRRSTQRPARMAGKCMTSSPSSDGSPGMVASLREKMPIKEIIYIKIAYSAVKQ